ncbi:MAG TPA: Ldh family oxidoreductase [Gemmatimonadaceae bacterium]|nr:Ldh family oxidoreductase [Gemmatimonadaceae bacterium]
MEAPARDTIRIHDAPLRDFCQKLLEGVGVPPAYAFLVADSLVASNLRGIDSHGIELLPGYIMQLRNGGVKGAAAGRILSETGGAVLYDGEHGLGQVVSDACCRHAVRVARQQGVAIVVARNSHHFGAAAYWSQKIAAGGCLGISISTAGPGVPPWQGKSPRIGTNPLALALPGAAGGKWLLDMATTTVAKGKVANATSWGWDKVPVEWACVDERGVPTTDRAAAERGWSLPLGGYKGTGLGMMIELLCAGLSGGPMATDVPICRDGSQPLRVSHTFIAINRAAFIGAEDFDRRTAHLVDVMKSSELRPGFDEVLVAGEPEWRTERERRAQGIPVSHSIWQRLTKLGTEVNISAPPADGAR